MLEQYKPPYTISDYMLEKVALISEKVERLANHIHMNHRPQLRRNNKIKSIYSSLKIEANSLPLSSVTDIIDGHLVLGKSSEIQEVKNAYSAYEQIASINPYKIKDLCRIHGIMTSGLVKEAGRFRSGNEGVFDSGKCIFVAPPPEAVPELMARLFDWMSKDQKIVHPLIMAAIFHYEFVFIHPFADGNGRMARLWHNVLLTKWRKVFEFIPLESQIERFQNEYYTAIARCHRAGNSDIFIEFILKCLDEIMDDVLRQSSGYAASDFVERLLSVMKKDVAYTSTELLALLEMKSRASFRKNYLVPALEQRKVVMTIPDKPNSRNQKYMKL